MNWPASTIVRPSIRITRAAQRLELISRLLKSDSRARVFYTVQSGYDTHALQLQTQANLLNELSSAPRKHFSTI